MKTLGELAAWLHNSGQTTAAEIVETSNLALAYIHSKDERLLHEAYFVAQEIMSEAKENP